MAVLISNVSKNSPADKSGIKPGDTLVSINGNSIKDVLDYRFYMTEKILDVELVSHNVRKNVHVNKPTYADLGLDFDSYLMDKQLSCKNKCIFCFVDQLPKGMRNTVYFKDDDSRMSFLFGNYVTLTNMNENDINRIIKMHISPVNISVHTMNPELRVFMMKNKNAGYVLKYMQMLADAGISMNTQIVACPGINDGDELKFSLDELGKMYPAVQSIAVVPVGVTKYRDNLFEMPLYNREKAADAVEIVEKFSRDFAKKNDGVHLAMAADEFYIKAGMNFPVYDDYGDFSQLENGVGMVRLFTQQFAEALENTKQCESKSITVATGVDAEPYLKKLADLFMKKYSGMEILIVGIENDFFGKTITVAGLVTGRDLIRQLTGKIVGDTLLIPSIMLRFEQDLFLDGISVEQVAEELGVKVVVVENDGEKFVDAIVGGR